MKPSPSQPRSPEEGLCAVAEGTANATGEDFFRALAQHLATALGLRYCFLTECLDEPSRVATLGFWNGREFLERFEYDLAGTPCHGLVAGETCLYESGVQASFPDDQGLADLEADSYAAVSFQDSGGRVIGHLAVVDVEPLEETGLDLSMLKIFAARAGAELERMRATTALEASEKTLRQSEERRKLDEQMRQAQKLESLGVLAGGIAHDFNNLLVGMLGNAKLALAKLPADSPSRRLVEGMETAARRAADLSDQMLAYSGRGRFVIGQIDLRTVIEEIVDLLPASVTKKAALRLDLGSDLPSIEADVTEIRQVVLNLITNAADALGEQEGVISLRTSLIDADRPYLADTYLNDGLPAGRYVTLEVSDSGCGMNADTRARIFDPFFTTKTSSRGMGLAAVLGIVRGHAGAIELDSEPGRGTTFRVLFPAGEAPAEPEAPAVDETEARGAGRTVLVVDDDPIVLQIAQEMLEEFGFRVMGADDGLAAIESVRRHGQEIDVVLLDMTMPHLDGIETLHAMRRLRNDLEVVLTSGYSEQEASRRLEGQKAVGFIQKPYRPHELARTIAETLGDVYPESSA